MEKEISKFPGLLASQLTNGMSLKLNISRKWITSVLDWSVRRLHFLVLSIWASHRSEDFGCAQWYLTKFISDYLKDLWQADASSLMEFPSLLRSLQKIDRLRNVYSGRALISDDIPSIK
jgi:hypothetical protein